MLKQIFNSGGREMMKVSSNTNRLLYGLILVSGLLLAMRQSSDSHSPPVHLAEQSLPYSFDHPPYVHPKIIQDLSTWISDIGDQVVAINLLDSQKSNRYFGDILVREVSGDSPFIYVKEEKFHETSIFGYQYIGTTKSGVYVLRTSSSGGGSGVDESLMFLTVRRDKGLSVDWDKLSIRPERERIVLQKLGEIVLGDRWNGKLRIEGNKIFIGKDQGRFSESEGGGRLSNHPKDRVLSIDIDR